MIYKRAWEPRMPKSDKASSSFVLEVIQNYIGFFLDCDLSLVCHLNH